MPIPPYSNPSVTKKITTASTTNLTGYLKGNGTTVVSETAVNLASADVTGNLPIGNLNSGTNANVATFWRGDGTWQYALQSSLGGGGVYLQYIFDGGTTIPEPNSGRICYDNTTFASVTQMSIHYNDYSATNVSAILATIAPGSVINLASGLVGRNNYLTVNSVTQQSGSSTYLLGVTPLIAEGNFSTNETVFVGFVASTLNTPTVLSTTTGINAKTTGQTTLYTVPTGKTAVITSAITRCTAASAITNGPTASIGYTSTAYTDIYAATNIAALTGTTAIFGYSTVGVSKSAVATTAIKLNISAASTGTSQTIAVDLIGYLV